MNIRLHLHLQAHIYDCVDVCTAVDLYYLFVKLLLPIRAEPPLPSYSFFPPTYARAVEVHDSLEEGCGLNVEDHHEDDCHDLTTLQSQTDVVNDETQSLLKERMKRR